MQLRLGAGAWYLYSLALRHLGPQTVALLMAVAPGLAAPAAVLDEPLSMLILAGLVAVTAGPCGGHDKPPR